MILINLMRAFIYFVRLIFCSSKKDNKDFESLGLFLSEEQLDNKFDEIN